MLLFLTIQLSMLSCKHLMVVDNLEDNLWIITLPASESMALSALRQPSPADIPPFERCGANRTAARARRSSRPWGTSRRSPVMITDFFNTGIIVLMIVLVALPASMALARTVQRHRARRR